MRRTITMLMATALVVACGGTSSESTTTAGDAATTDVRERLEAIDQAVSEWRAASSLEEARRAAETAANLVVGPGGPGYGDRNGDGTVDGAVSAGLLPGLTGEPAGLALGSVGNECVLQDVLGGDWSDPAVRWAQMTDAIAAWAPNNNTMPTLASHPMRIVGWATFTLASNSLDDAIEYGGHAALHVGVSRAALDC